MSKGFFVVVDGIDGAGKTTLLKGIADWLGDLIRVHELDRSIRTVRDPGSTLFGEQMRGVLKSTNAQEPLDKIAEFLAFSASRAQLAARKICPAVSEGHIVLSDRFAHSTFAYQGRMRGIIDVLGFEAFMQTVRTGMNNVIPDLVLWLDTPPEVAKQRASDSHTAGDVFDEQPVEMYHKLAVSFAECVERDQIPDTKPALGTAERIDGAANIAEVLHAAKTAIKKRNFFKEFFFNV